MLFTSFNIAYASCNKTITVTGVGKVNATYDLVVLNFEAIAEEKDALSARDKVESMVSAFFTKVKDSNLDESVIRADSISLRPKYTYQDGNSTLVGYIARRNINVSLKDFTLIAKFTDLAMQANINSINDFSYSIEDIANYQNQALDLAVADAKAKASRIADNLAIKLGSACEVNYSNIDSIATPRMLLAKASDNTLDNAVSYQVKATEVKAIVEVKFIIK